MGPVYYGLCDQQDRQASQIDIYCVLFVRVVKKHVTSTFLMKHSYQYKNKLEQLNVPFVKDGSEIELFTSVMVAIIQCTCIEES